MAYSASMVSFMVQNPSIPVVFTGSAENGVREVVFAFDLHDSNFAMLMDYLILSKIVSAGV